MIRTVSSGTTRMRRPDLSTIRNGLLLALLTALLGATPSFAMTDIYELFQTTGSGTEMRGSTQIFGPYSDYYYNYSRQIDIGFPFVFDGQTYNTFSVSTSGLMSLGRETFPYGYPDYWPNSYDLRSYYPLLTAQWFYYGGPSANGQVHYKITGTEPNRVMTVEWQNIFRYNDENNYTGGTWQIRLHEGSNLIEFWYGPFRNVDYWYAPTNIGIASSDTRYINIWGNSIDQYYTYPSGQYYFYRYAEEYPIEENTIFQFSSCDRNLEMLVGNPREGGVEEMEDGSVLLQDQEVMRGNTTEFRPFAFDLPENPCAKWTYEIFFSGPGAADYTAYPENGTLIEEGLEPVISFTPRESARARQP